MIRQIAVWGKLPTGQARLQRTVIDENDEIVRLQT